MCARRHAADRAFTCTQPMIDNLSERARAQRGRRARQAAHALATIE
jgi:hypothetical protein